MRKLEIDDLHPPTHINFIQENKMPIMAVEHCPNCSSDLRMFSVEGKYEGIMACTKCNLAFIPDDFGEYTKKMKAKLKEAHDRFRE